MPFFKKAGKKETLALHLSMLELSLPERFKKLVGLEKEYKVAVAVAVEVEVSLGIGKLMENWEAVTIAGELREDKAMTIVSFVGAQASR